MKVGVDSSQKKVLNNLSKELNSCATLIDELSSLIKDRLSRISSFGTECSTSIQKPISYGALNNNLNLENLENLAINFTQDCERSIKTIRSGISRLEQCLEHLNNLI